MRINLRLIGVLLVGAVLSALVFDWLKLQSEVERQKEALTNRAVVLGEQLASSITPVLDQGRSAIMQRMIEVLGADDQVAGLAVYNASGSPLAITPGAKALRKPPASVADALRSSQPLHVWTTGEKPVHEYTLPLQRRGAIAGAIVVLQDASGITDASLPTWPFRAA
jgi:hypothetical protein